MKIALVHELLTMRGGAEGMLRVLADMFPDAPIYTLLYDEKKLGDWFPRERIKTSRLQKWAWISKNHHLYLKLFPRSVEAWDFSEYDLVIGSSSAFVHGLIVQPPTKFICYIHTPARYLWDRTNDVLSSSNLIMRWYGRRIFHRLRQWDAKASERGDVLLVASKEVQRRIELYWRRESTVLYPPVDDFWFESLGESVNREYSTYFLIVSTLVKYKRIELAIEACNATGHHLKIVGEGPNKKRLQSLSGPTIEFYGTRENDELKDLYVGAQAVIFPGDEDFGIVPIEAMSQGTPVIAYRGGGALETVVKNETGIFFDEPTAESLSFAIKEFEKMSFDSKKCRERAEKFSRKRFEDGIRNLVTSINI